MPLADLSYLLQEPIGAFINAIPGPVFILIHVVLALLGVWLWRKAMGAGNAGAARGFMLFVIAELLYITYHLDVTTFLFAHTLAEVCDALGFLSIGLSLTAAKTA